jgi:ATP-binding cassette subfamily B protein
MIGSEFQQSPRSQIWRERLSAFRYLPPMLKLVWEAHKAYTVAMVVLRLVRSFTPVAILWVGKLIIDTIVALRDGSGNSRQLWNLIALEITIVVIHDLLARVSGLVEGLLANKFNIYISARLMAHAATLDLCYFEDPAFYDQLERARRQATNRLGLLDRLLSMAQDLMTFLSLSAALYMYSPLMLLLLTITVFPSFFGETHFITLEYILFHHWTSARRYLDYLCYVGTSKVTAKEIQLFGLAPWLISRFQRLSQKFYDESKRLSIRKVTVMESLSIIGILGYYTAYAMLLFRAVDGSITLGTLTFLISSFTRARDLINLQLMSVSNFFSHALYLKDLFDFFNIKPLITAQPGHLTIPRQIAEGIVFENVSFRYPGGEAWAVRQVSFNLRPGERIAFVGENGAGKTTITKLLARLYDPTEGRILLDGRDIREYDIQSFRRAIGVIFQDFVCYDWRFSENIGVGEIETVKSYLDSLEMLQSDNGQKSSRRGRVEKNTAVSSSIPLPIISAAEMSLASTLLPRFSEGYHQMLGRRFEHGIELSGGEWQKIALARAYMRDAQVLILDEPTASLDARAEYEVFKRFSRLVTGRMAVIISHRFSTVRMADRIIVLQNGFILEEGTHSDLIANRGLYEELFTLQAKGYH